MEVQTLKCTSCGAPIKVSNDSDIQECPYCHNQIKIPRDNGLDMIASSTEQITLGGNKEILIHFGNETTNYPPRLITVIIAATIIFVAITIIFTLIGSIASYVSIHNSINNLLRNAY